MSGESGGLLTAMLAVQSEAPTLRKDKVNPAFRSKFTPLDTIVETINPLLSKHGLVWMTLPVFDERGDPALHYRLAHAATGEVLEGTMPLLLTKRDAQGLGSALTYARRYSLCAVLNLVSDDDDDGNGAKASTPARSAAPAADPVISAAQRSKIVAAFATAGVDEDGLGTFLKAAGVTNPEAITVPQAMKLRSLLDEHVQSEAAA